MKILTGRAITLHVLGCDQCVMRKGERHLEPQVWLCPEGERIATEEQHTRRGSQDDVR